MKKTLLSLAVIIPMLSSGVAQAAYQLSVSPQINQRNVMVSFDSLPHGMPYIMRKKACDDLYVSVIKEDVNKAKKEKIAVIVSGNYKLANVSQNVLDLSLLNSYVHIIPDSSGCEYPSFYIDLVPAVHR